MFDDVLIFLHGLRGNFFGSCFFGGFEFGFSLGLEAFFFGWFLGVCIGFRVFDAFDCTFVWCLGVLYGFEGTSMFFL